jgi:hypothetical protein
MEDLEGVYAWKDLAGPSENFYEFVMVCYIEIEG